MVEVGEYVLATKYEDGDPCDHFYVGFVSGYTNHGRYLVCDNDGVNQRANGFRRAEVISAEEGAKLVALMPYIGDKHGKSLWWHLGKIRGEENPHDPCNPESELLPCPFCGGTEVTITHCDDGCCGAKPRFIECPCGCELGGNWQNDVEAIKAWSRRDGTEG